MHRHSAPHLPVYVGFVPMASTSPSIPSTKVVSWPLLQMMLRSPCHYWESALHSSVRHLTSLSSLGLAAPFSFKVSLFMYTTHDNSCIPGLCSSAEPLYIFPSLPCRRNRHVFFLWHFTFKARVPTVSTEDG
eukprot:GGOE01062648.1.p1 GENE.GGOE01062648.1~~GGOE01062648.1.p1  ORF type:complete len:132 (+),score=9.72 GGOE01062648.1:1547-1942(+)